jgi:hypothetical protein
VTVNEWSNRKHERALQQIHKCLRGEACLFNDRCQRSTLKIPNVIGDRDSQGQVIGVLRT